MPPVSERFRRWARQNVALELPGEDEPLRLTWTLLLDWKAPLAGSVEEPFMRAGTYHIFAVDGLRIGLLLGISLGLLRLVQIPRPICGALALPILWFYAGLTGWPASAVRATIMASVIIVGWMCRRPGDLMNSLFAAAAIVLLWAPSQLFPAGLSTVLRCGPLHRGGSAARARMAAGKALRGRPPRAGQLATALARGLLYKPASFLADTLAVSFAAWIGSIPLAACYFHVFTLVSLPANCVVVPATALALMSAMGSLLTGAWLPGLAGLFNNTTWVLMKFIIWFSRWAAQWPGGNCNVAAPSPGVLSVLLHARVSAGHGLDFSVPPQMGRLGRDAGNCRGLGRSLGHGHPHRASLPFAVEERRARRPGGFAAAGKDFLVCCGAENSANDFLKPFLCVRGVNRLAGLCLAVGRLDYFGGARTILGGFPAAGVFTGVAQDRSPAYRELLRDLRHTNAWRAVKDGDSVCGWSASIPAPPINSRKPTTTPWRCSANFTAIRFCFCRHWAAMARKPCCAAIRKAASRNYHRGPARAR